MQATSDPGSKAVDAAYAAVKPFPPRDQLTATPWAVVALLSAIREKSKDVYEALAYLQQQIAAVRFPTTR